MNLLNSYHTYFRNVWPILSEMSRRGIPIDEQRRLELKSLIEREDLRVTAEIQAIVPAEVLSTKQKMGFKNPPILTCEDCGYKGRGDHICTKAEEGESGISASHVSYTELAEVNNLVLREVIIGEAEKCRCTLKARGQCPVCVGTGIIPARTVEVRWAAPKAFNPNSKQQVIRFMRHLKHPVPKHQKRVDAQGEASDTTEVKELERLYVKTKHPIYPMMIDKRQLTKMMGTYVEGWKPSKDGRIHTTYSYGTATWQLAGKSPNSMNGMKRGRTQSQKDRVEAFNRMQRAEPGHILVSLDYKSFHGQTTACEAGMPDYLRLAKIDIHSFTTCHFIKHPERHGLLKLSDAELKAFFDSLKADKRIWTNGMTFKEIRNGKTKSCIAEGELVLTDQGLVPIQNVTLAHRLWDGIEWVNHEGLIDQGIKEVITYGGLAATPDHKVCLAGGRVVSLGEAASQMARLQRSGIEGHTVWTGGDNQQPHQTGQWIHAGECEVFEVRPSGGSRLCLFEVGTWDGLPTLRDQETHQEFAPDGVGPEVRRDHFAVFESCESEVSRLRRQGDQVSLQLPRWVRSICGEDAAARFVPWDGDRQDRQRRELRAGEFEAIIPAAESSEPAQYSMGIDRAWEDTSDRMGFTVQRSLDAQVVAVGHVGGADYSVRQDSGGEAPVQELAKAEGVARTARTYDLLNAGPRHRFTVSGRLVLNCGLGIGFGMRHRKLYQMYKEDFENEREAEALWNLIMRDLFPDLLKWQERVKKQAAEEKRLVSRFGAIRHFFDVQRFDRRTQRMVGGDQGEAAIAFLPASNAFGMIRWAMLNLREKELDSKYELINTVHDSLTFHPLIGDVEALLAEVISIMQAPCPMMVYPGVTGPEGLSVEVEAGVGDSMADMH